jgi:hypothetical protein
VLDARARGYVRTKARAVLLFALCATPLAAQTNDPLFAGWRFTPPSVGSRPAGLGGAFVAIADSVKAAIANPAGLTLIPITEIGVSSGEPWAAVGVGRPRVRIAGYASRTQEATVQLQDVAPGRVGALGSSVSEAGLALGLSLHPRLKIGGSIASSRLSLDGERRVPGSEGTELTAASVSTRDTHVRASAGLLLVLVGTKASALPSLRFGLSWQPGFDWSAQMTDEGASAPRAIAFRRPTLVSGGLAWRASDRWSLGAQGDIILYSEVLSSLERNIGEAALDFTLPSTIEPRFGAEYATPLGCGCGVVRLRGGLHYRSPGTLHYIGPDPILRRTFTQESWRTVAALGASFFTEHMGHAVSLDVDARDVFEGPDLSFGIVWRF